MKKLCFAIMILAGVSVVSCSSGDDDHTPSWFVDKNLTKADIADHYYADGKIYIHIKQLMALACKYGEKIILEGLVAMTLLLMGTQ